MNKFFSIDADERAVWEEEERIYWENERNRQEESERIYWENEHNRQEESERNRQEESDSFLSDSEADADALASVGWGVDEDYNNFDDDVSW